MCNIVKALRDEGKKKEKNLIYSKCVQKKKSCTFYIVQLIITVIFVIRECLIIMNCKTCMKKILVDFVENVYISYG